MENLKGTSKDIVKENIDRLKNIFPEVFCEEKIDLSKLQEILGEYIQDQEERYCFQWKGKSKSIKLAQTPSTGTLRAVKEKSKNWDKTKNLYIEGDNMEVLKLLQKTYHNSIKMIYIDPPYNTGNDFVYRDNYKDSLENYVKLTNQVDQEGKAFSTNKEASGRYHTQWLNMMYPRLRLAKNLLKEDGVIFISIDDNEVANLRKICDEIFGEGNFITQIVWEKVHTRKNSARYFSSSHEYILCYAKNKVYDGNTGWRRNLLPREDNSAYKNPDNDPKGPWKLDPITAHNYYEANYKIEKPNGVILERPQNRYWVYSEENWKKKIAQKAVVWGEGDAYPMVKRYLSEVQDGLVPITLFSRTFAGDSASGNKDLASTLGLGAIFTYPKPVKLIKRLMQIGMDKNDIILDFFSGSATTAHAVMELNVEDGGNRKYILVQLPEITDEKSEAYKAGYKNLCDIGIDRIKKAGDRILEENKNKKDIHHLDIGFKLFKLDTSNLKRWNPDHDHIAITIDEMMENFVTGRTEEDVLYEIMLKYGIDLTYPVESHNVGDIKVYNIGLGALFICLADHITLEVVKGIIQLKNRFDYESTRVVFKDNGFEGDSVKTNALQILKENHIDEVMCI